MDISKNANFQIESHFILTEIKCVRSTFAFKYNYVCFMKHRKKKKRSIT